MKMKLIAVAFAATSALTAANATANSGTVKFTGKILDTACKVDVQSQDKTVALGTYGKSEFNAVGDTTTATKFTLVLTACPDTVTSAAVKFDGTPDATDSKLLAIDTGDTAAEGVAINIMTADKAQLPLAGSNTYAYALKSDADNSLDFYAQYQSTAAVADIKGGDANGSANFSVIYN